MDQGAGVTARTTRGGAAGVAEVADPAKVRLLYTHIHRRRHGSACWKLLFYALWHRRHILGFPPAGDVFETLTAL